MKRPPIAYYNAATGGVVITPPKSLFTSFSKSLDKAMQVGFPPPALSSPPIWSAQLFLHAAQSSCISLVSYCGDGVG